MAAVSKERRQAKHRSFPKAVRHALEDNWEATAKGNQHMYVGFKKLSTSRYSLVLKNVLGNGFDSMRTRVMFKSLEIDMRLLKDGRVTFVMPALYHTLSSYYKKHVVSGVTPIVYATQLLDFLSTATKDLNVSGRLPGHHYQPEFSTSCDRFKMVADGMHISVEPLATKTFEFSTECTAKRGYIINTISALVDYSAYLFEAEKRYFGRQAEMHYRLSHMNI